MIIGPEAPTPRHISLVAALHAAAVEGKPHDGLVFVGLDEREQSYSWSQVLERAERSAAALARAGVKPGDRVAIVLPTSVHFMDAFFGALCAGAVPVPLYPPVRLARLREYEDATLRMLEIVDARALVVDARVKSVLGPVATRTRALELDVESLANSDARLSVDSGRESLSLIQFSSGATVDPKPVALTHAQLLAQTSAIEVFGRQRPGNTGVGCSWLPLYHDMGLIGCLLVALTAPGKLVLIAPEHFLAKPALWLRAISRHRAFISAAPNFAYALCTKRIRDEDLVGLDLSSWTLALNGAEPVLQETIAEFSRRFGRLGFERSSLVPVYGLSEAALAVTFASPGRDAVSASVGGREVLSVGAPAAGFCVRIIEDGREVADGVEGEIEARGPSITHGYFRDDKATARTIREGWLSTGDRGFVRDGELFITGRSKDVVIVRGQKRMPQEFEEALLDIDGLRTGRAVALSEIFAEGEGLLILAERARGRRVANLEGVITERVLARTGIRPSLVRVLDPGTLPRTSSGKVRRAEALLRHRKGTLQAAKLSPAKLIWALMRSRWLRVAAAWAALGRKPRLYGRT